MSERAAGAAASGATVRGAVAAGTMVLGAAMEAPAGSSATVQRHPVAVRVTVRGAAVEGAAVSSATVPRHPVAVRVTHWAVALSGLALLFSGMGQLPMFRRYNIVKLPGLGWSDNFEIHLIIHYVAAAVFTAAVLFHLLYHLRRREFAALPRRGDMRASWHTIVAMLRGRPEPPSGKFLAEQRVAYAAIGVTTLTLLATGLVKSFKNLGPIILDPALLQWVTLAHTAAAMLFMVLVGAHVAAFLIRANRPLLPSMITGRVCRHYAAHRHPFWQWCADVAAGADEVESVAVEEVAAPVRRAG
jgi:cytochrome b subunit of formate dehydrogenase